MIMIVWDAIILVSKEIVWKTVQKIKVKVYIKVDLVSDSSAIQMPWPRFGTIFQGIQNENLKLLNSYLHIP